METTETKTQLTDHQVNPETKQVTEDSSKEKNTNNISRKAHGKRYSEPIRKSIHPQGLSTAYSRKGGNKSYPIPLHS